MTRNWLMRHGQSQSNAGYTTHSSELTQLTEVGKEQAKEIVDAFHSHSCKPSLIVYSKFMRTKQTAQPTIDEFFDVPRQIWPDVREFTYLAQEKCQSTTRQQRRPLTNEFWNTGDPDYRDGDEAESFRQFLTRVSGVLERLRYSKEDFIAVFTHGQFIQATLWILETSPTHLDEQSKAAFRQFCAARPISTGAIQEINLWGRSEFRISDPITSHLTVKDNQPSGEADADASASQEFTFASAASS